MLTRRDFIKTVAATAAVSTLTQPLSLVQAASKVIKPPHLKPGSVVGIVSPASATFVHEEFDIVQDAVRALGLVPQLAPHVLDQYGYLAGKDGDRANDINQLFADPKVAAILPIRGGWGCSRILPYLDYQVIQNNPKIIVGFSDITALLVAIHAKTGLVTFHGPNGLTSWRTQQTESFRRVLFTGEKVIFKNDKDADDNDRLMQVKYRIRTINPGKVRGKLIGGNLSVFSTLVGSPYLPDLKGAILFLEEVEENIYRIDRFLTHLKLAGVLKQIDGFIFGQCPGCTPGSDYGSLTLEQVLSDHIKPLNIPAWHGATIGHMENILTFPIGSQVEINANSGTITMLESAVSSEQNN
ncbi:LD-carboxypeptidase [Rivularia sp. UHCC 0363]|uniref:S66 peptidase family protein n=1 Tax=Rivularia sp. UHCC 0363 TaxID=3110244 RepID=UPI002B1F7C24|nr:LD-carboxypeptidase [Rivularia sp. UHCC 0363]MEA5593662.1 LD-carboxypeptidase [Rivularia sp. UHCC 0363]